MDNGEYYDMTLLPDDRILTEIRYLHAGIWTGWTVSGQSFTMVRHGDDNDALSVFLGRTGTVYWNNSVARSLVQAQLLTLCGFHLQGQQEEEEEQIA